MNTGLSSDAWVASKTFRLVSITSITVQKRQPGCRGLSDPLHDDSAPGGRVPSRYGTVALTQIRSCRSTPIGTIPAAGVGGVADATGRPLRAAAAESVRRLTSALSLARGSSGDGRFLASHGAPSMRMVRRCAPARVHSARPYEADSHVQRASWFPERMNGPPALVFVARVTSPERPEGIAVETSAPKECRSVPR